MPIIGPGKAVADNFLSSRDPPWARWRLFAFRALGRNKVYALEIVGDNMDLLFREGDLVFAQPGAAARCGDRTVLRTKASEVITVLGRRNDQSVEVLSVNPRYPPRMLPEDQIDQIARIKWTLQ